MMRLQDAVRPSEQVSFLRYVGSKQRHKAFLLKRLPVAERIDGRYIDPFVGAGVVFLGVKPQRAMLSDLNPELMALYHAIAADAAAVWKAFSSFPEDRSGYYRVRSMSPRQMSPHRAAARTLYLNRTCFGGNVRYNARGEFNVGYGGQERRWAVGEHDLLTISRRLAAATLTAGDFEEAIDHARAGDIVFADPPYAPGARDLAHDHYTFGTFGYQDHRRLVAALVRAEGRGASWAMTTSSHPDILALISGRDVVPLPRDPYKRLPPGIEGSGEVLVRSSALCNQ